jgi:hypothetical protein
VTVAELAYRYRVPSVVRRDGDRSEVLLRTSGGVTGAGPALHPCFFQGLLRDPGPTAAGMLACAVSGPMVNKALPSGPEKLQVSE